MPPETGAAVMPQTSGPWTGCLRTPGPGGNPFEGFRPRRRIYALFAQDGGFGASPPARLLIGVLEPGMLGHYQSAHRVGIWHRAGGQRATGPCTATIQFNPPVPEPHPDDWWSTTRLGRWTSSRGNGDNQFMYRQPPVGGGGRRAGSAATRWRDRP